MQPGLEQNRIYRITKFNPNKRDKNGVYTDTSEWTSITDIGKIKYNSIHFKEYYKIETAYVESIKLILREKEIDVLKIDSLELYGEKKDFEAYKNSGRLKDIIIDFEKEVKILKNEDKLTRLALEKIIRLILRETIWMNLFNANIEVTFGYDYYMYVKCEKLSLITVQKIKNLGLFVELQDTTNET